VELRAKAGDNMKGEIETCFNALYGTLLMRLSGKEISADTMKAIQQISRLIAMLSHYHKLDEQDELFKDDE
jgi:nitrate reductase NapAB chaperone NapD